MTQDDAEDNAHSVPADERATYGCGIAMGRIRVGIALSRPRWYPSSTPHLFAQDACDFGKVLEQIANDSIGGNAENGGVRILVDRNDDTR